jgi:hypothetical protein
MQPLCSYHATIWQLQNRWPPVSLLIGRRTGDEGRPNAVRNTSLLRRQADFGGLVARAEQRAIGGVELLEDGSTERQGLAAGWVKASAAERRCERGEAQLEPFARCHNLVVQANRDRIGDTGGDTTPSQGVGGVVGLAQQDGAVVEPDINAM